MTARLALTSLATLGGVAVVFSIPSSPLTTATPVSAAVPLVSPHALQPGPAVARTAADGNGSWTVYHGDSLGTGVDTSGTTFSSATRAWTSPQLDGQLFGEPLELDGLVYVATENDTVYALATGTGRVVWSTHVGTPVASSSLPCGDISPLMGITGTPVIDAGRHEIFAVADEAVGGLPSHHLIGLNTDTGAVELDQVVDPPGANTAAILQRTGLNLSDGSVVFGYGGNAGDCSIYHGWVVRVPETGGTGTFFDVTSGAGEGEGAVWMGGAAPLVDRSGNVWVATGNGDARPGDPYDGADSVLELSPQLSLKQFFAPSNWATQNSIDQDLGSSPPALLSNGAALQAGKAQTGYELDQADLGGIGGQVASASLCPGGDVDGGEAIEGSMVYIPCQAGMEGVNVSASPPGISVRWSSTNATAPPILAGGLLWAMGGAADGTLFAVDPSTGRTVQQLAVGANQNHFPTPSVGAGLLLVPTASQVVAYRAGPPPPPPPPNRSYWLVASDGGIFTFGSAGFDGSLGDTRLNAPIVGMAAMPDRRGYSLVAADGGVFCFGDAGFFGSMGGKRLDAPIVGMATLPGGGGYWLVAADGGVFSFGHAGFFGSMGGQHLDAPIVGMAVTPDGGGYWLVAADGGVFSFGDALFDGSMGGKHLDAPIVGAATTLDGRGYWLVAADGGVFSFGDALFDGSMGGRALNRPVVGMAVTPDGGGYWLVASDGGVFSFGDALFDGSMGGRALNRPIVGLAAAG
jgi:outer membrane protein assembly factor BamB